MRLRKRFSPDVVANFFENLGFLLSVGHSTYNGAQILYGDPTARRDKSTVGI